MDKILKRHMTTIRKRMDRPQELLPLIGELMQEYGEFRFKTALKHCHRMARKSFRATNQEFLTLKSKTK